MDRHADIVVVGAGLAGLTAARELVRAGQDVVVIEARDRVGGRTLNHHLGNGKVVEVGGQWIGPTQDHIAELAAELGVETFPTFTAGDNLLVLGGKTHRYSGELPPFETDTVTDILNAFVKLEDMAQQLPIEAPWQAANADEWDAQTFRTFIDDNAKDAEARAMLELLSGAIFTVNSAELSLLHVLVYIRSAGSLSPMLTDIEGGAQELRFVGGSQRVSEVMASQLGDRVVLAAPVRRISQHEDRVIAAADGIDVTARRCIVAVPPTVADRIAFDPPLPAQRAQLQRRMAAGSVIKVNAIYDEPFWRADGLSGRIINPPGPLTITFDNSPPDGTPGVLMGFLEADEARRLGSLSADERRTAGLRCLAEHFGPQALAPADYVEGHWDEEEWTRGCYGANLPPGTWTRYGAVIREPVGLLHWASAETATRWVNYMDGAVSSGQRAAGEALVQLG
jgi:monoamine oxidase